MGKNGIIAENEGYFIIIDGVQRSFRDVQAHAYAAAVYYKQKHKAAIVEVLDRSTGKKVMILEDGRTA